MISEFCPRCHAKYFRDNNMIKLTEWECGSSQSHMFPSLSQPEFIQSISCMTQEIARLKKANKAQTQQILELTSYNIGLQERVENLIVQCLNLSAHYRRLDFGSC